ncbi:MAG: hypothetical protein ACRDS1_15550 [Pseudonocardiaceae bacterium]
MVVTPTSRRIAARALGSPSASIDVGRDGVCGDPERRELLSIDSTVLLEQEAFPLKQLAHLARGRS